MDRGASPVRPAAAPCGNRGGAGEKARRLRGVPAPDGRGRVCGEVRAGRRDLVPCSGAGQAHPAPGIHAGGRLRSRRHPGRDCRGTPRPALREEALPLQRINLIIDIQERLRSGKGPGYERWAKVYNLKQMAAALQYLREHELEDYATLEAATTGAVDRFHALAGELRETEAALAKSTELMAAVVDYAKTRPVFDGYKAARYSKKYLAQHESELATYRAAKAAMNDLLAGGKLPKMEALKKSRRELAEKKKALYGEYRKAQREMREAVAVKTNIDHLLGVTGGRENKAQER